VSTERLLGGDPEHVGHAVVQRLGAADFYGIDLSTVQIIRLVPGSEGSSRYPPHPFASIDGNATNQWSYRRAMRLL
jgi:hypothetical protein